MKIKKGDYIKITKDATLPSNNNIVGIVSSTPNQLIDIIFTIEVLQWGDGTSGNRAIYNIYDDDKFIILTKDEAMVEML